MTEDFDKIIGDPPLECGKKFEENKSQKSIDLTYTMKNNEMSTDINSSKQRPCSTIG